MYLSLRRPIFGGGNLTDSILAYDLPDGALEDLIDAVGHDLDTPKPHRGLFQPVTNTFQFISGVHAGGGEYVYIQRGCATPPALNETRTINGVVHYCIATQRLDLGNKDPYMQLSLFSKYPVPTAPLIIGATWTAFGSNTAKVQFSPSVSENISSIEVWRSFNPSVGYHYLGSKTTPFSELLFFDEDVPPLINLWYIGRVRDIYGRYSPYSEPAYLGAFWNPTSENPVLTKSAASWDSWGVFAPSLLPEGAYVWIVYTGTTGAIAGYQIGVAYLPLTAFKAGLVAAANWTKGAGPIISPAGAGFMKNGVGEASVVQFGAGYLCYFTGFDDHNGGTMDPAGIGLAYSGSLAGPWTVLSTSVPIIPLGDPGEDDHYRVWGACVVYAGGYWWCWYSGCKDSNLKHEIFLARSTSPYGPFVKIGKVLSYGTTGEWDDYLVCNPRPVMSGNWLINYFNGADNVMGSGGVIQIGTSFSSGGSSTVYKTPLNPDMRASGANFTSLQNGLGLFRLPDLRSWWLIYASTDSATVASMAQINLARLWR